MFEQTSKSRLIFLAALIIGVVGACGQAYLIHHELVDCYPYKVISYDYGKIAKVGVYYAPIAAVLAGCLLGLKRFWLATIAPVVLCPLFFACVFKAFSIARGDDPFIYFDGKTAASVEREFFIYALGLAFTGLIIGAMFCLLLSYLSRQKNSLKLA